MTVSDTLTQRPVVVEVDDLWKSFGGNPVLRGVNIDVHQGEIHALVGGNGAGKSTLMKAITGLIEPDAGRIAIGGNEVKNLSPKAAHANSVYMVPQEPKLFPNLSVYENVVLALGSRKVSRDEVSEVIGSLGHPIDLEQPASELSISDQQLIELVRGILREARLLIVDEPTAALTAREVDRLFAQLRQLAASGVGIFYVSHRMSEIFELCDRVTVLRDGNMVLQSHTSEVDVDALVQAMVPDAQLQQRRNSGAAFDRGDTPVMTVESMSGQGFVDVSFEVYPGEVLGIAGVVGSGRTELAETLYGLRPGAGAVHLNGAAFERPTPRKALERGLAYVPEDRHAHGIFLIASVVENTTASVLKRVSTAGILSTRKENELTDRFANDLSLQAGSRRRRLANLSGGNQQKVSLAKALASNPSVIILDEPSRGVDVAAREDLYRLIDRMALEGLAVVLISSDFEEVVDLSHRVLVMRDGRIRGELAGDDISLRSVRDASFGSVREGNQS
ncbi:ABC transporter ATP-binding protein [Leucobacter sp. UCD-THU]|nr:ABC transporter ATP-binding protein [Leucobacter sp. UCD-THU]